MADQDRLRLYRYVTAPEADDYLGIMSMFTSALLVEWSPQDLLDHGLDLPLDTVSARCKKLADDGNLLLSPREVRVTSIAEYQSQPVRYTVSALGGRLHREVERFLKVTGVAREVPRELLAVIAAALGRIDPADSPETLAGNVITIFAQFRQFASSVIDFYTYIGSVLNSSDLDSDEWAGFKALLIDYLESIVESVRLQAGLISEAIDSLWPRLPELIARMAESDAAFAALEAANSGGDQVERSEGRRIEDWEQMRDWFGGPGARQLGEAAHRAVGALLASLKRINAASSSEASLRRHFLKLAAWFDASSPAEAHVLATAAFGVYPSRHLAMALDPAVAASVPASASWWSAPRADVPVSLRERGDRAPRGRSALAPDHHEQRNRLTRQREEEAIRRAAAAAELLSLGDRISEARLSAAAVELVLELLSGAAGGAMVELSDHPVALVLVEMPGSQVLHSSSGDLTLDGRRVRIGAPDALRGDAQEVAVG